MRAINLLPRDADARRGRPPKRQWMVIVPVICVVLVSGVLSMLFLSASGKVKDRQAQLDTLKAELAAIPTPDVSKVQSQSALVADKDTRIKAVNAALSRRVAWDRIFRELSLVLPSDVKLTGLSMSSTNGAPAVNISGYTYSHDAVARLLSRLQTIPEFGTPSLPASTRTVSQGVAQVTFSISVPVGGAAAAAPAAPAPAPPPATTTTDTTTTGATQ